MGRPGSACTRWRSHLLRVHGSNQRAAPPRNHQEEGLNFPLWSNKKDPALNYVQGLFVLPQLFA